MARKIPYVTRAMFNRLGILGFEMHRQVFAKEVADYLPSIQHKDWLGYKDVIAVDPSPHQYLVRFLQSTVPAQLARYRTLRNDHRELLEWFAQMTDGERNAKYHIFSRAVFPRHEPDEGEWREYADDEG